MNKVDKVIGCTDKVNTEEFVDDLVLVNSPSVETATEFTDAKVNEEYFRDVGVSNRSDLSVKISSENDKKIVEVVDSEGVVFPSIKFKELQSTPDSVVLRLSDDEVVRLLKVSVENGEIVLPDSVADKIINSLSIFQSYWEKF